MPAAGVTAEAARALARPSVRAATPPRVLLIEPNDDLTVGGSYQVLYDLSRQFDRARYEPVALFNRDNVFVGRLEAAGVEVHVLDEPWTRERRALSSGHRLRQAAMFVEAVARRVRFLRRHGIALVHMNGTPQTGHDDWLPAARMLRIPALATCAGNLQFDVRSRIERRLMRSFDRVLPVSAHVAAQLRQFGYGPERTTMIHPGIDVAAFRSRVRGDAQDIRDALGAGPETMLVTMVGNLRRWKGQHVAIEAVSMLAPAERARTRLAIAGAASPDDAAYERELRGLIDRWSLRDSVTLLGRRDDIPDLMAASDVVLHASTDPEPFGLVIVEAMALGRAVVASDTGGPAEILDEASGLRFAAGDARALAASLAALLAAPARRAALGAAGLRRSQKFTIESTAAETFRIYDEVLGAH